MKKEKIKNTYLQRMIALKAEKLGFEDVTEEDIDTISSMVLRGKNPDGRPTGINLDETLGLFGGIEELDLMGFTISDATVGRLLRLQKLKNLQITDCVFSGRSFTNVLKSVKSVKFISCSGLHFEIRGQEIIDLEGCEVDFSRIHLEGVRELRLIGCSVRGIRSLRNEGELQAVILDGSRLTDESGDPMSGIAVPPGCRYSHIEDITCVTEYGFGPVLDS